MTTRKNSNRKGPNESANKHKIGTVIKENINNVKIDVGDRVVTLKVNYDFLDEGVEWFKKIAGVK